MIPRRTQAISRTGSGLGAGAFWTGCAISAEVRSAGRTRTGLGDQTTSARGYSTTWARGGGVPNLFIAGSCAEFQWPDLLGRLEGQIPQANGDVADLREDSVRRFQAAQDRSLLVQQFSQARLDLYIKEVLAPVFGVNHFWRRYESAKSRGQIHFERMGAG